MRKITIEEIEKLHQFVRQHYVEFYDVELELVDHLAQDIEEQWTKDTALSFENALACAFKKFGIFGFTDVVEQKVNKLSSAYYKESFRLLKAFFSIPKIVVSFALFLLIFTGIRYIHQVPIAYLEDVLLSIGLVFIVYQLVQLYRQRKQRERRNEPKWLLHAVLFNLEIWPYYFITFIEVRLFIPRFLASEPTVISLSAALFSTLLLTVTLLYVFILKMEIVPKIIRDLDKQKEKLRLL